MTTPIIIDKEVTEQLQAIVRHGQMNKYDHQLMRKRAANLCPPPGDLPGFGFTMPLGYRIVYSCEQRGDLIWFHHFSCMHPNPGKLIKPEALFELIKAAGVEMPDIMKDRAIWIEDLGRGRAALNVAFHCTPQPLCTSSIENASGESTSPRSSAMPLAGP